MSIDTKSAAILVSTLSLGVVLGLVAQGEWLRARRDEVSTLTRPRGFVPHMESVIVPRPNQQAAVRAVLEDIGARNQRIIDDARAALRVGIDSMQLRLAPVLDTDQRERLAAMSRLPDPFRPPPPGGPP